ncbi:homeobox-leucine zipper protein ATHB-12-like isoform X2 [Cucurbita moschata]|nr:homeobox-leucine zipper protein ATHB-12-like isoform X2 [Cucurbita moschata]
MEREEYFILPNFETAAVASSQTCSTPRRRRRRRKKKTNNMNKRRFSDEQIRSLESIFYSSDSKLDSRKKVQLATELGLQPRQIAIWFQNRRARWKSKEMENNFRSLRANYDNLASQFKTLQEEKNSLLSQLQKLSELVHEGPREGHYSNEIAETIYETKEKPQSFHDELGQNGVTYLNNNYNTDKRGTENGEGDRGLEMTHSSEGRSNDRSHAVEKACQLLNPNGSFESSENWCGFDSDGGGIIFEYQPCSSLQELSFWG